MKKADTWNTMTLRDLFAAAALASGNVKKVSPYATCSVVAVACYEMADAMLAAREGQ